ncbi:AMP-binding protein, partial [Pantoea sp. ANP04]|uniref:AMP-binding protein n=1 Tax=Pantoea sp. ANP04 TaxID=3064896 RepID=UPI0035C61334
EPGEHRLDQCIHHLFSEQALARRDAPALTFAGQTLSYSELDSRANRLAWMLRERGVGPQVRVGLALERSLDMVVGLLAILKAGGAYVPLDPEYPRDRLAYMIEDSGIRLLLSQRSLLPLLDFQADAEALKVILLDQDQDALLAYDSGPLETPVDPLNLAYVIYTSGSTGLPKGVMVEHRNVARLFSATRDWFDFNWRDVWALFHSFAFDFSVWEIWGALIHGGQLLVVPQVV